jgi:hypothetical protein
MIGALGLFGCGGGSGDDDDDIVFVDAGPDSGSDIDAGGLCNAVSQTGCPDGQRCTFIIDDVDSGSGHIGCADDGTQAIGDTCTRSEEVGVADDCAKGGYCYNGTCRDICTTLNDTCEGQCGDFVDGNGNPLPIEWCLLACDPLAAPGETGACAADNEGCYLSNGDGVCLRYVNEFLPGEACTYTNDCAPGGQCFGPAGAGTCRQLCGTIDEQWGVDKEGLLTWPKCCGSNCTGGITPTLACGPGVNQVCWLVSDGTDTGVANTGICLTDVEASNPEATMPFSCDCAVANADGEYCAFD